jgi:hypothetical protein
VTVSTAATDDAGVRVFEQRVHGTNGAVGAWTPALGADGPQEQVSAEGAAHVEARAWTSTAT